MPAVEAPSGTFPEPDPAPQAVLSSTVIVAATDKPRSGASRAFMDSPARVKSVTRVAQAASEPVAAVEPERLPGTA